MVLLLLVCSGVLFRYSVTGVMGMEAQSLVPLLEVLLSQCNYTDTLWMQWSGINKEVIWCDNIIYKCYWCAVWPMYLLWHMAKCSLILVLARRCKCVGFLFQWSYCEQWQYIFVCDGDKCVSIYANNLHFSVTMYVSGSTPVWSLDLGITERSGFESGKYATKIPQQSP